VFSSIRFRLREGEPRSGAVLRVLAAGKVGEEEDDDEDDEETNDVEDEAC